MARSVRFPQYLKKHGLFLIFAATESFLPGLIVEKRGSGFYKLDTLRRLLPQRGLSWGTTLVEGDMPDAIVGRKYVEANGSVKLPFLTIKGGLKRNSTVDFSIGAIHVREFTDDGLRLWNPLRRQLRQLKRNEREKWADIKGHYVVVSTWYASRYSISLARALSRELDTSFKKRISVEAGAKLSLDKDLRIVNVTASKKVPFAFFGRRLRGIK